MPNLSANLWAESLARAATATTLCSADGRLKIQGCMKFRILKSIKSFREEYLRGYNGCGELYNVEKGKVISPSLKYWGCWEEYQVGTKTSWKKIKTFKNNGWEEYEVVGNYIHPWRWR